MCRHTVRLIVPGWYGVASVKWLTNIELIDRPFDGFFQADRYHVDGEPLRLQQVRSLVIEPRPGQAVEVGDTLIRGVAWSGTAPIAQVEVSIELGPWRAATLVGERRPHSWQWWELATRFDLAGDVTVRVRATDLAGRTQPEEPRWNQRGYANNAIHEADVTVSSPVVQLATDEEGKGS